MEDPLSEPFKLLSVLIQEAAVRFSFSAVIISFLIIVILLLLLALLSAAEVAFFTLKPFQVKEIRTNKSENDDLVALMLQDPKKLLATLLISINFLNVSIVILSTFITHSLLDISHFPILGFILQVVAVTTLILFFGEILPKVYATQQPEKVAVFMSKPLQMLVRLLHPISHVMVSSTQFVDKRMARKYPNISMSELEEAIDITTNENTPEEEKKILKGIVNFSEIEVKDIMKSRIFITAVENNISFPELMQVVLDSGYSRIPVYEDNLDKVTGTLYTKDLLPHLNEKDDFQWTRFIRQAFFVPEGKKINDLMADFQQKKNHLAIVVDEYGGTSGIITLEDVIEEIVGEINDEFDTDTEESGFSKLDEHNFVFRGEIPMTDFCRVMKIDPDVFEKVKGESGTLAGLILEITGKIPEPDEKINFGRFIFRIESADKRRIKKIKVTLTDASNE